MAGGWSFGTNYLSFPAGDFAGTGAYTMALLVDLGATDSRLMDWFNSTTEKGYFLHDSGALFGKDDFTSGVSTGFSSSTSWAVLAITKAAGSATYRMHYWLYASDGSGTMGHGVASGAGNHANESPAATTCRVGFAAGASFSGNIAAAAWWDRALSDAELDTLKSASLQDWADLSPDLGIELENWNGSSGDVVFAGSSGNATLTGTVSSTSNPPSFDFTVGGGGGTTHNVNQTDAVGITDARIFTIGKAITDSVGVTDQRSFSIAKSFIETIQATDEFVKEYEKGFNDFLAVTDQRLFSVRTPKEDAVAISDAFSIQKVKLASYAEALNVTDSLELVIKKIFESNVGLVDLYSSTGGSVADVMGSVTDQKRVIIGDILGITEPQLSALSFSDLMHRYWSMDFPGAHAYDTKESGLAPVTQFSIMDHFTRVRANVGTNLFLVESIV